MMRYEDAEPGMPVIRNLTHQLDEEVCTLRWRWPEDIQAVYIHRSLQGVDEGREGSAPDERQLRLYTRNEYKANNGYHERIDGVGRIVYTVYASIMEDGETVLIRQPDGDNRKDFSTGKAKVRYSIRQKSGWLKKYKTIEIRVTSEIPISKDVLCYVKKQGGYPASKDDGTVYPFVADFAAGRNVLPEIEVGKNDYVRLFLTDGKRYGQIYELVSEG